MDSSPSSPFLLFSVILCLLSLLIFKRKIVLSKSSQWFPPGPRALPIIGNIHNIFGSVPHHALRDLSNWYGPVMLLCLGEIPTVVISSSDAAKEIMKTHDINFASRPITTTLAIFTYGGKGTIFPPYGEYWRQLRKICVLELLSIRRVQSFRSIREEEVENLINYLKSCAAHCQPVNLSKRLTILTNDIVTRAVIGSKSKDQDMFLQELERTVKLSGGFNLPDLFPSSWIVRLFSTSVKKAERSQRVRNRYLDEIIRQHRQRMIDRAEGEAEDMLSVLLRLQDEGSVTNSLDTVTTKAVVLVSL